MLPELDDVTIDLLMLISLRIKSELSESDSDDYAIILKNLASSLFKQKK